jgi:hypothetical protein
MILLTKSERTARGAELPPGGHLRILSTMAANYFSARSPMFRPTYRLTIMGVPKGALLMVKNLIIMVLLVALCTPTKASEADETATKIRLLTDRVDMLELKVSNDRARIDDLEAKTN